MHYLILTLQLFIKHVKLIQRTINPGSHQGSYILYIEKNSLYQVFLQKKTPDARDKYKSYKNKLTNTIRLSERQYFQNKFELAKGNIKKTWEHIESCHKPT